MSFALMDDRADHSPHTAHAPPVERTDMPATATTAAPSVLIRAARGSDGAALARLAELDSSVVPAGALLVAESDGRLVAAIGSSTGEAIADPFLPTADVLALLQLRAAGARSPRSRRSVARRSGARRLRMGGHAAHPRTA
jgi:hypothetical protein